MDLFLRIWGAIQVILLWILHPLYFLNSLQSVSRLQPMCRDVFRLSASTLARKIRNKELKSEEAVRSYVFRARRVNIWLFAVVEDSYVQAIEEACAVDQLIAAGTKSAEQIEQETPLLGVPITVKECCKVNGMSYSIGSESRAGIKADCDGTAVALMKKAGAIVIAVTNTSELCAACETQNLVTGRTSNPYDMFRTPGGSSGGEAALISIGGSIIGLGSDIAGCIRIPAMFCGIFGHKPTPDVVPMEGHYPLMINDTKKQYWTIGPMTRYAEDLKLVMKIIAHDNSSLLNLDNKVDISQIRVLYMDQFENSFGMMPVDWEIKQAIEKAAKHLLADRGCVAEPVKIKELSEAAEITHSYMTSDNTFPDALKETDFYNTKEQRNVWIEAMKSFLGFSNYSLPAVVHSLTKRTTGDISNINFMDTGNLQMKLKEMLGDNSVLLLPSYPTNAHYHNQYCLQAMAASYAVLFSALKLPATQVPMGLNRRGLPIGIQVVGGPYQDRLCLAVAEELESAFGGWVEPPAIQVENTTPGY